MDLNMPVKYGLTTVKELKEMEVKNLLNLSLCKIYGVSAITEE
jgi:hypothetical protein